MDREEAIIRLEQILDFTNIPKTQMALQMAIDDMREQEEQKWIPVSERKPDLIPCNAGTAYSEAVMILTSGRKVMDAIWDGIDWIAPFDFWEAWGEKVTHWMPLPELPKEDIDGETE